MNQNPKFMAAVFFGLCLFLAFFITFPLEWLLWAICYGIGVVIIKKLTTKPKNVFMD